MDDKIRTMRIRDEECEYSDRPGERRLDLRPFGVGCIPRIAMSGFSRNREGTSFHRHKGCVEICLCLRGNLYFESGGMKYPFFPGRVFTSRPDQAHRMKNNPKGLRTMDALFAIPGRDETVLGLPAKESAWLVRALLNPPTRLFPATERLRSLFAEMFALYDAADMSPVEKRLKMRSCALAFLLAVADAPTATPAWRNRSHPALKAIVDRMRRDPMGRYPAAELAREAGLSEVRFFEAFKRETGFSPLAYRLDMRVRLAWRDIAAGASIGGAAARYGFSSPQHFSSVFKRIVGSTPRECRWKQPDLPG